MNKIIYHYMPNIVAEIECLSDPTPYQDEENFYVDKFIIRKIFQTKIDSFGKIYKDKELDNLDVYDYNSNYIDFILDTDFIKLEKNTIYDRHDDLLKLTFSEEEAMKKSLEKSIIRY